MLLAALVLPVAAFFLLMGVAALADPARILRPFGVEATTPGARTEVRAVYGGFGVAVAAALVTVLLNDAWRDGILITTALALAGMAAGRLASAALGERPTFWPSWAFFAIELALAALLLLALAT